MFALPGLGEGDRRSIGLTKRPGIGLLIGTSTIGDQGSGLDDIRGLGEVA